MSGCKLHFLQVAVICIAACMICACRSPEEIYVDGGAMTYVVVWEDINENGVVDDGEPPIPGISVYGSNGEEVVTDDKGQATVGGFVAGCESDCWKGDWVSIEPPVTYVTTTDTSVELTGDNQTVYFGLKMIPLLP